MPVFYECQRCTACCRWPGDVRVGDDEISRLAAHCRIGENDFIQRYTRLSRDRRGLSLIEKANGECVFLDGDKCAVQPVKPQQCRDFPNLWRFAGFESTCRSRAHRVDVDEYVERVVLATGRSPDYVRAHPNSH